MPNVGPLEIVILLLILLVIFGPKRIPELGRSVGQGMRNFKQSVTGRDHDEDAGPRDHTAPRELEREPPSGAGVDHAPAAPAPDRTAAEPERTAAAPERTGDPRA